MRVVHAREELLAAVESAARESGSAFGDDTVFLERYVERSRHVEIQVIGDEFGNIVSLHDRECSIQRRHQKIIEEAPSPAVDVTLRKRIATAAVTAAEAIDYVGAGTVEFLLTPDGEFFFLEMNTRLQVEHPVTELVTGIDLVRLQLLVAEGRELPAEVHSAPIVGHAIEVRLYAEDPAADFMPVAGTLHDFTIPTTPGIRVDSGFESGSVIGINYDPMLAKVIAHAPTRSEAARALAGVLDRSRIHGVTTNRDLLIAILGDEQFLAGAIDTQYLERHPPVTLVARRHDEAMVSVGAVAAAVARQALRRADATVQRLVPSGFRNAPSQMQTESFAYGTASCTWALGWIVDLDSRSTERFSRTWCSMAPSPAVLPCSWTVCAGISLCIPWNAPACGHHGLLWNVWHRATFSERRRLSGCWFARGSDAGPRRPSGSQHRCCSQCRGSPARGRSNEDGAPHRGPHRWDRG